MGDRVTPPKKNAPRALGQGSVRVTRARGLPAELEAPVEGADNLGSAEHLLKLAVRVALGESGHIETLAGLTLTTMPVLMAEVATRTALPIAYRLCEQGA